MIAKAFWKSLKMGDRVKLGDSESDWQPVVTFIKKNRERDILCLNQEGEIEDYPIGWFKEAKKVGRSTRMAHFKRSDNFDFVISRVPVGLTGTEWRLIAGCREFHQKSLAMLEKETLMYWEDDHMVDHFYDAKKYAAKRIKLNRESRRKISKAIAELKHGR